MTVTIRRTGQTILNEDLPVAITDPAELAVWDIPSLAAWYRGRHATMQGVVTARPFKWMDRKAQRPAALAVTGQAPIPTVAGNKQYLQLGYGGSLTQAANGSLQTPDGTALFSGNSLSMAALVRTPVPAGVAGATPGGFIAGSKLNHSATYSTTANVRAWGFAVGRASFPGRPRFMARGDAHDASTTSTGVDHRDGLWHVYVGIIDDVAKTVTFRIDGVQAASPTSLSTQVINSLAGSREMRIGATGLPAATTLEYQFAGDVSEVMLFGGVLAGANLTAVESFLLAQAAL